MKQDKNGSSQEILERLSSAIVDNKIAPGTKLGEAALAEHFGTSRAKIREILLLLKQRHIINLEPNRGAFVAAPTAEETRQICEARRVVECAMVRQSAHRITPENLESLREILIAERQCWDVGDLINAVRYSRSFHMKIAEYAANEILRETLHNIMSRSSLSASLYGVPSNPGCLCQDHYEILDAIAAKDADKAEELMVAHLDEMERRFRLPVETKKVSLEDALSDI